MLILDIRKEGGIESRAVNRSSVVLLPILKEKSSAGWRLRWELVWSKAMVIKR